MNNFDHSSFFRAEIVGNNDLGNSMSMVESGDFILDLSFCIVEIPGEGLCTTTIGPIPKSNLWYSSLMGCD